MLLLVSKKEISELNCPFGCGNDPLFTYPFFGEDQTISLQIPPGTPEQILESLEIVLCIENGFNSQSRLRNICYLGVSDEKILSSARGVIEEKLLELMGFEIEFIHSWTEYQDSIKTVDMGDAGESEKNSFDFDDELMVLKTPLRDRFSYVKFQILLPFFIEAATSIDTSDPKWTIFLSVVSGEEGDCLTVRGLLTAYKYFRFPEGCRVRISQVLVFPRYQGHRLGTNLYRQVSKYLRENEAIDCAEICVEDPTDAFERLRSLVDYENARNDILKSVDETDVIKRLEQELKLSNQQAERIFLLHKSVQLGPAAPAKKLKSSNNSLSPSDLLRQNIKRWLMRKYRKDLPEDSNERIKKLAELYEAELEVFIEPLSELLTE